jgi:hypothetical protein
MTQDRRRAWLVIATATAVVSMPCVGHLVVHAVHQQSRRDEAKEAAAAWCTLVRVGEGRGDGTPRGTAHVVQTWECPGGRRVAEISPSGRELHMSTLTAWPLPHVEARAFAVVVHGSAATRCDEYLLVAAEHAAGVADACSLRSARAPAIEW